jgi:regulator of RNase E activity RraB
MNIPDDADGDAMRRVLSHGSDPTRPMDVDFMIACPDVTTAEKIASLVSSMGFTTKISVDKADNSVTLYCVKHMLLDYDALMAIQSELNAIAQPHRGYIDGWGTFGNAPEAKL